MHSSTYDLVDSEANFIIMPAGVSAFMLAFSLVISVACASMISWNISRDLAFLARLRWLRYAMYFFATSFLGLFMSSISTWSWMFSTLILSSFILEIADAISAARTMSSPSSVTSIALSMASTILRLSNSTTLPSRLITFLTIRYPVYISPLPLYRGPKMCMCF